MASLHGTDRHPFLGRNPGESLWRQTFGVSTHKERTPHLGFRKPPVPGGSYGRTSSNEVSQIRLLEALRSKGPGNWSDNRWEQTNHFVGMAYAAIHRICIQLQRAEYQIYKKDPSHQDGKRPVTPLDPPEGDRIQPPYDLVKLLEHPNPSDSFGKLMYRWGQQKYLTGTALTWMAPNKLGTPMELYCIPTAIAMPQAVLNPEYPHGYYQIQPVYPYGPFSSYPTPYSSVGARLPSEWMLKFLFPHPLLRYDGYSPLTGIRYEMDEFEMIGKSRHYKMRRAVAPTAVLDLSGMEGFEPLDDTEITRIQTEFENTLMGPENAGRLFIPPPGGTLAEYGVKPTEMDYPTSWAQIGEFVLGGGFGITKPAAGMVDTATYSVLWAALKQLYWLTLDPECEDIGSDLTRHLAPFFGDDLIVEVRSKPLDDHEVKIGKVNTMQAAKCITKNEVRKEMGYPTTQEKWGNDIAGDPTPNELAAQQAAMMGEMGMPAQPPPPGTPPIPGGITAGADTTQAATGALENHDVIRNERPMPGKLARGGLAAIKQPASKYAAGKSLYQEVRDSLKEQRGKEKEAVENWIGEQKFKSLFPEEIKNVRRFYQRSTNGKH